MRIGVSFLAGGCKPVKTSPHVENPVGANSSCWRYNRAYNALEDASGALSTDAAILLLQSVSQFGDFPTIWSVDGMQYPKTLSVLCALCG